MPRIPELLPDYQLLLAMAPEELAPIMLEAAATPGLGGQVRSFTAVGVWGPEALFGGLGQPGTYYPRDRSDEIEAALGEAWAWLEHSLLIMPAAGANGQNGWRVLTRRGRTLVGHPERFAAFQAAAAFPKALLHPAIAEEVWLDLARGDYATAVFRSFRAVEEAVRAAGGYRPEDVGVDLMRSAFNADNGPLRKPEDPAAEQQALAHLFAGAIGSYKNPHSHRHVVIADAQEAQEMVVLASHLLRIVDDRKP